MKIDVCTVGLQINAQPARRHSVITRLPSDPVSIDLPEGATIEQLIERLGVCQPELELVVINGQDSVDRCTLNDGDAVLLTGGVVGW